MDSTTSSSLALLSPNPHSLPNFNSLFTQLNTSLLSTNPNHNVNHNLNFSSTSISLPTTIENPQKPTSQNWLKPTVRGSPQVHALFKTLSVFERAFIGAGAGGMVGAFTYVCLHPLDTIKTKMQTKGASKLYESTIDAFVKTFQEKGILGFYSGVSAVIVGSTASSAVYFGTCEFGKSVLGKLPKFPPVLIPPSAGFSGCPSPAELASAWGLDLEEKKSPAVQNWGYQDPNVDPWIYNKSGETTAAAAAALQDLMVPNENAVMNYGEVFGGLAKRQLNSSCGKQKQVILRQLTELFKRKLLNGGGGHGGVGDDLVPGTPNRSGCWQGNADTAGVVDLIQPGNQSLQQQDASFTSLLNRRRNKHRWDGGGQIV